MTNTQVELDWYVKGWDDALKIREPLSDVDIVTMYAESPSSDKEMIEFARAIEQAHGIGVKNAV